MRHPKELTETELQHIANRVRKAMTSKGYFSKLLKLEPAVLEEFVRQTYIEVRAQLEKEGN